MANPLPRNRPVPIAPPMAIIDNWPRVRLRAHSIRTDPDERVLEKALISRLTFA
jgi:hypothetical protein